MAGAHALGRRGETLATGLVRVRGGRVLARNERVRGRHRGALWPHPGSHRGQGAARRRRGRAVGPERVAGLGRAAQWLAESRGYEWVQRIRLDVVTIDGRRVRYYADVFRP